MWPIARSGRRGATPGRPQTAKVGCRSGRLLWLCVEGCSGFRGGPLRHTLLRSGTLSHPPVQQDECESWVQSVRRSSSVLLQLAIRGCPLPRHNSTERIGFHKLDAVGIEGFEPPAQGLGNGFPCDPLHCHQPSSQLRHNHLFRHSSAWAGVGFLPLVSQGTQAADRHAASQRRTRP
jgi:hypothetical protein